MTDRAKMAELYKNMFRESELTEMMTGIRPAPCPSSAIQCVFSLTNMRNSERAFREQVKYDIRNIDGTSDEAVAAMERLP
jgi:hypothetical protein